MGSGLSKAQRDCYQKYGGPGSEQHAVVVQKYTRRRLAQLRVARIRFKLEKEKVMQKLNMWKTKRQTENAAAAKLQAILRGHRVRKRAKKKMDKLRIEKEKRDKLAEEKRLREEEERRNREEERLAESAHLVSEPLDESITLYGWNFVRVHICEFFWLDRPCDRCASETTGSVLMGCDLGPYHNFLSSKTLPA